MRSKKISVLLLSFVIIFGLYACSQDDAQAGSTESENTAAEEATEANETKAYIEDVLNLANNDGQKWTYSEDADAWVLSAVSAVAYPELPDYQGVSVCVPGAYVTGIDTDGDGAADEASGTVKGSLVIDYEAQVTSSNGQIYTAATAPVILNTGAAGYSAMENSEAATSHAADGYINVSCGNRGKQSTATDEDGNTYYTGDAPSCLADQKAAARFVKYNILLGNLPGNVDYFVSTGGSGGGAHATMFAATGNNSDFYDYQIEAGAVGVYKSKDGTYSTAVTIDGVDYEISDGAWGCIAYSAITPLYEADMSLAFEYYLNTDYSFGSSFQAQLAEYLSASYMEYINGKNLSVEESAVGFDLDGDGERNSTVALTIEYDPEAHPETNGYYGSYLDLYLAEFTQNLQWYLDNLDYSEGWTWFNEDGSAMSDEDVAAMDTEDKAEKFIAGLYSAASSGGMMGGMPGGDTGGLPNGGKPDGMNGGPDGTMGNQPEGELPGDMGGGSQSDGDASGMGGVVGTPDSGTTQSASGSSDSANYATYEEMVAAYKADIEDVYAGDEYGNNIVELYNPLNYIGAGSTDDPAWTKIIMGASEGDMSMFNSLNLQIAWLNAGVDAEIEWQWDGGHVPSEILGDSFSLYVDQMYGEYIAGAASITKSEAVRQTKNGTAEEATGTNLDSWVSYVDGTVSFTLADAAAYRTNGASKAMPGFDVIDYGQEDYVFGDDGQDARHWDKYLLEIFEQYAGTLEPLFNQNLEKTIDEPETSGDLSTPTPVSKPGKVTNVAAASGKAKNSLKITWSQVSSADGYRIRYSYKKSMADSTAAQVYKGSILSKTLKNITEGKAVYIQVRAYVNSAGSKVYGDWSSIVQYFPRPAKVTGVKARPSAAKKKTMKVSWAKVSSCNGYQIRYSYKRNMASSKTVQVSKAAKTSRKISNLASKKYVYVQVRAYKNNSGKKVYGAWSKKVKRKLSS